MIQALGLERVIALLNSDLSVIAIGDGSAPVSTSTELTNETLRKPVTVSLIDGNTLVKEVYFDESEANGMITEIGLLGAGATVSVGTGQLFGSGAASITKDNTQSLTISFEIEVKEVV